MIGSHSNSSFGSGRNRFATTLIACAWGMASAYALFYSLLIKFNLRDFLLALVPLVAVWAAIERKRWGRLAMLGLSSVALGACAAALGLAIATHLTALQAGKPVLNAILHDALYSFGGQPQIAIALLVLGAMTAPWMCRPAVRDEYESGKKATLAVAQKAIAMTVVGCWGVTFLLPTGTVTPHAAGKKGTQAMSKTQRQGKRGGKQTSTRANRSAAPRNSA